MSSNAPSPQASSSSSSGAASTPSTATKAAEAKPSYLTNPWDPLMPDDSFNATPTTACIRRIMTDIRDVYSDPAPGICIYHDPEDVTKAHALIIGPADTPYEGGFFYFLIKCPPNYPYAPPRVRLMTTGNGTVRLNPNLYKNGKVCLSILGTWAGPSWEPINSISSVLISIQSLMNEEPYRNEPSFEVERVPGDIKRYNQCIQHETLRVAVIDMIKHRKTMGMPDPLVELMVSTFVSMNDMYTEMAQANLQLDGAPMRDPFGDQRGDFRYATLLQEIKELIAELEEEGI